MEPFLENAATRGASLFRGSLHSLAVPLFCLLRRGSEGYPAIHGQLHLSLIQLWMVDFLKRGKWLIWGSRAPGM